MTQNVHVDVRSTLGTAEWLPREKTLMESGTPDGENRATAIGRIHHAWMISAAIAGVAGSIKSAINLVHDETSLGMIAIAVPISFLMWGWWFVLFGVPIVMPLTVILKPDSDFASVLASVAILVAISIAAYANWVDIEAFFGANSWAWRGATVGFVFGLVRYRPGDRTF